MHCFDKRNTVIEVGTVDYFVRNHGVIRGCRFSLLVVVGLVVKLKINELTSLVLILEEYEVVVVVVISVQGLDNHAVTNLVICRVHFFHQRIRALVAFHDFTIGCKCCLFISC